MPGSAETALCVSLALPQPGQTTRTQHGPWQVVVDDVRGGLVVLVHDGRVGQRVFLGAVDAGELLLRAHAPRHRVRVRFAERLTLAPKGRLRGYVAVPLPHELLWRHGAEEQVLAELVPRGLQTSWLGERVGYVHEVASRFSLDVEGRGREADAIVSVVLRNLGPRAISPEGIVLRVAAGELRALRGRIIVAPRTMVFRAEDQVVERVHPFLGGGA